MDTEAKLSTRGGGLTDQIGHSGSRLLLIFFREQSAYATSSRVEVGGVEVSKPQGTQNHPAPFPTAYSKNIYVGGFPFSALDVSFDGVAADQPRQAARFKSAGGGAFEANSGQLRLVATADDALTSYQQRDFSKAHVMEIAFDPPLPSAARLATIESVSSFVISLDGFANLLSGAIIARRAGNDVTLDWRFKEPARARARILRITATLDGDTIRRLELAPVKAE
jgi:hypothetical protein